MSTADISKTIAEYLATQPVNRAWLFGSYARGEQREDSDVDLLVELDHSQRIGLRFFGMYADLKEILNKEVDLVADGCLLPFAQTSADHDKILIYERNSKRLCVTMLLSRTSRLLARRPICSLMSLGTPIQKHPRR